MPLFVACLYLWSAVKSRELLCVGHLLLSLGNVIKETRRLTLKGIIKMGFGATQKLCIWKVKTLKANKLENKINLGNGKINRLACLARCLFWCWCCQWEFRLEPELTYNYYKNSWCLLSAACSNSLACSTGFICTMIWDVSVTEHLLKCWWRPWDTKDNSVLLEPHADEPARCGARSATA